jgi:hypothetical protein
MERTFSKMGGGSKDTVQWYYIDKENNYVGPVNTHKMRQLKKFEYVTAESYVWASHLSGWKLYNQVPDLAEPKAAGKPPPSLGSAAAKAGAPPSIGMAAKKPAAPAAVAAKPAAAAKPTADMRAVPSAANAPPTVGMAGMSLAAEEEEPAVRAGRADMLNAPEATDEWDEANGLRVLDEHRKIRCTIAVDGTVADGTGKLLAYIEPTGDVGSPDMDYLGKAANGLVQDRDDQVIGSFDQGRGLVKDEGGSTILEISKEGVVIGNSQKQAGWVEGFSFDAMQTLAAFVHLVDPDFIASY